MPEVIDKVTGEVVFWPHDKFLTERDRLLLVHDAAKKALEIAKEAEMAARKAAVEFCFDQGSNSGTQRIELGGGYEAKAVKKINYGWVKTADGKKVNKEAIDAALTEIETLGNEGPFIAERLVSWVPTLSVKEYGDLAPAYKAVIDRVIVTTDGAPTLEIIAPKVKAA